MASGPGLSWYYLEGYALPQTTQTTSHACLMGQIKDHLPCLLGALLRNAIHAPGLSLGSGCRWTLGNPLPASCPALLCPSLRLLNAPSFNHIHKNLPPTSRKPKLGRSWNRDIHNPEIRSESARSSGFLRGRPYPNSSWGCIPEAVKAPGGRAVGAETGSLCYPRG